MRGKTERGREKRDGDEGKWEVVVTMKERETNFMMKRIDELGLKGARNTSHRIQYSFAYLLGLSENS